MIKNISITNYLGENLIIDLSRPEDSGFVVNSITGLGPGKATINATEISTNDGGIFNSARLTKRNIVLSLSYYYFMKNKTIEDIRHMSYKYFPIKKPITLTITTDNRVSKIVGYVESNEANIFSKESGTTISIICPDPYFYSESTNNTVFSGIEPMFEFPFENESVDLPTLVTGNIKNKTENLIIYNGDANVGVIIRIHAVGEASNITIYNTKTRELMKLDSSKITLMTGSGIINGDDIIINTMNGQKSVTLIRNGSPKNILNCLSRDSSWFTLAKGDNLFAYTADTGSTNLQFVIENKIIYEGV